MICAREVAESMFYMKRHDLSRIGVHLHSRLEMKNTRCRYGYGIKARVPHPVYMQSCTYTTCSPRRHEKLMPYPSPAMFQCVGSWRLVIPARYLTVWGAASGT